jgi:hypothetical protein
MFPIDFPLKELSRANHGQWVLDPFCGRGTTVFAARLLKLNSIGIDFNPIATTISEAKLLDLKPIDIIRSCNYILDNYKNPTDIPTGEFWDLCYHEETLREICSLREVLSKSRLSNVRKGLRAILLGALHGPLRKGGNYDYLSNQMPRSYASKPAYSVKYWRDKNLIPPRINVINVVKRRAERYYSETPHQTEGSIICGDSRTINIRPFSQLISWIVTSPPYYGMRTYIQDQWLRYWFLGGPPSTKNLPRQPLNHSSPDHYSHDLSLVWKNISTVCQDGAHMVIRFGGINDRKKDPIGILKKSIQYSEDIGWDLIKYNKAGTSKNGRRQADQFGLDLDSPVKEYDFHIQLNKL